MWLVFYGIFSNQLIESFAMTLVTFIIANLMVVAIKSTDLETV